MDLEYDASGQLSRFRDSAAGGVSRNQALLRLRSIPRIDRSHKRPARSAGHVRDQGEVWPPKQGKAWSNGLTYAQARYYNPVTARFSSPDPVGFAAGGPGYFNRYAYTMNDPVNATDPTGMLTHVYIGGAGDRQTRIVQSYASRAARDAGPGRTVAYFSHDQRREAVEFARANANNGEPLNIIGHSYGANTAVGVVQELAAEGISVDALVGVDGVRKAGRPSGLGSAAGAVDTVVGVSSTGSGSGNTIESLGRALGAVTTFGGGTPRAFQSGNADVSIEADVSHADFQGAFEAPGLDGRSARDIVDETYNR